MKKRTRLLLIVLVLAFLINTILLNYSLYKKIKPNDLEISNNLPTLNKGSVVTKDRNKFIENKKTSEGKQPTSKAILISFSQEDGKKERDNDYKKRSHQHSKKLNKATIQYIGSNENQNEVNQYLIKKENGVETLTATSSEIEKILSDNRIKNVELDQRISLLSDKISEAIIEIKADKLWDYTTGKGIKIAILDSGISPHDDLKIAGGISFVSNDYTDYLSHGTEIAGIISALLNEKGIAGVAPEASIYAVKIANGKEGNLSSAAKGFNWAIDNNMSIITMSFGFNTYSQIFKDLVTEAYKKGIILVSAAGNDGVNGVLYPAKYEEVIAVGSIDKDNAKASFSNYGPELELVAPGTNINTTAIGNGYAIAEGTSYSTAYVTGVAGLLKAYNLSWDNTKIRSLLHSNALDLGIEGKDEYYGYGLVQASLDGEEIIEDIVGEYNFRIYNVTFEGGEAIPAFWKGFNGSVENVSFSKGYYVIEREFAGQLINETLNASEESPFKLLDNNCYTIGNGFNQERLKGTQIYEDNTYLSDTSCTSGFLYRDCEINKESGKSTAIELLISFEFPFFIEDMGVDSAELSFEAFGTTYDHHDGWVEVYSTEPFPTIANWAYKPATKSRVGTSQKISGENYFETLVTNANMIKTGFNSKNAYYNLKGISDSDGRIFSIVNFKDSSHGAQLKVCYSGAAKVCDSGACCDVSTGTYKPNGTACGPIENPVCDSQNSCGGHAVQDQCTGTSAVCPNSNIAINYSQACYEMSCGGCGICGNSGACDYSNGIECNSDSECNDFNQYTKDTCINPATCGSYCGNVNYCGNNRCDTGEDEISCETDCKVNDPERPGDYNLLYDSVGNLIADINFKYEYDEFNQLIKVKDNESNPLAEYFYDDQGSRIKKIDYSLDGTNTTTYYPDSNFVRVVDSSGTHDTVFYYDGGTLVGRKDETGTYFYHPDHLGSTNLVTDINGNVVERTEYLPFGAVLKGGESRFLFTGKEKDSTGLMYYGARYYDPFSMHFTQADTIIGDVYDPLSLNKYAYARNNPVKYTDPSGNTPWSAIAGVIGFGLDVIKQILSDDRSIFSGTIDWGEASTAGISSAIGSSVGITSFGLTSAGLSGLGIGSITGTTLSGIASGGIGVAGYTTTSNLLSGRPLTEDVFESTVFGAEIGGVLGLGGGVTSASGVLSKFVPKSWVGGNGGFTSTTRSLTAKNIENSWHKGSFPTPQQNFAYHYTKQGSGLSEYGYTKNAQDLWQKFGDPSITEYTLIGPKNMPTTSNQRSIPGFKIGGVHGELGIYDDMGKIVSYHQPKIRR